MEKKDWKERFMKAFAILLRKDFKIYARPIDNPSNTEGEFNHIGEDLIEFIQQKLDKAREEGRKEGIEHTVRLFKDKQQLKEWLEKNNIEGVVKSGDVVEAGKKYATTINLN